MLNSPHFMFKARVGFFGILIVVILGWFSIADAKDTIPETTSSEAERPFVLLIQATDSVEDSLWYKGIDHHASKAAKALDIDFEHFFAGSNWFEIPKIVRNRIITGNKPDYILFSNQVDIAPSILELSNELGIKAFIYGSPLSPEDVRIIGGPREKLSNWIGQIIPDDEQAGFELASTLIKKARAVKKESGDNGKIKVLGFTGTSSTPASVQRTKGLYRAVQESTDVELLQVVSARWLSEIAAEKFKLLTSRYGEVDVVWAANDDMALAILEESRKFEKLPKIGGFDWTPPAMLALKKNELSASMGGHDFEVAYALKIIGDYHYGSDFFSTSGITSLQSKLVKLTPENIEVHSQFFDIVSEGNMDYFKGLSSLLDSKEDYSNISIESFKEHVEGNTLNELAR